MTTGPTPVPSRPSSPSALEITNLVKNYSGLRPLRIAALSLAHAERVAIAGIDAAGAEVLVNLVTGATLPDAGRHLRRDRVDLEREGQGKILLDGGSLENHCALADDPERIK